MALPAAVDTLAESPTAQCARLLGFVSNGQKSNITGLVAVFGLGLDHLQELIFANRVVVGAGAQTYALASYLLPLILDALLNFPHFLSTLRNSPPTCDPVAAAPVFQPAPAAQPVAFKGDLRIGSRGSCRRHARTRT
ncbi:hypothetical protein CERSUDRAFT_100611 [Gelatoporia subvermispora B]|uniref:Uncharacterized protein n=1 Tax=Ceriporiopsis subvermispora (strain B) TaxID=914234 RepID=M2Q393_CERS8|nr:hypothetical protein CERSUDRAFT_100611 [Gelatoporia subvermispora B]